MSALASVCDSITALIARSVNLSKTARTIRREDERGWARRDEAYEEPRDAERRRAFRSDGGIAEPRALRAAPTELVAEEIDA